MKKLILINLFLFCLAFLSFSQTQNDSIQMKKMRGGYFFFQKGKKLKMSELLNIMKPNEQAYKAIKDAQKSNVTSFIIGCTGSFMVGRAIGSAIAGREPDWFLTGIGAGLLVFSFHISKKCIKQAKLGVDEYNSGLKSSTLYYNTELKLALTENRVGLVLRF